MSEAGNDRRSMAAALPAVLAAGRREDFERLLAEDVHWRGEDGAECRGRAAVGDYYAEITTHAALDVDAIEYVAEASDTTRSFTEPDGTLLAVTVTMSPHDPSSWPLRRALTLTIRDGLISQIVQTVAAARIEVLHVDDCPNHDELLPRLRRLLADHDIDADLAATHVVSDDDARRSRFLGSPTVRVNGRDVDPSAADRTDYGLQCRLYRAPEGTVSGAPTDAMLLDALIDTSPEGAAVRAIHTGDLSALRRLLDAHPDLIHGPLAHLGGRTLLHAATDWPGHFPNVADTIATLIAAGADPNAAAAGPHSETPLHWAASSNDVDAIDALLDGGADIDAPGAVIAGGTPMADATAFGQWAAARRLLERGARTNLWEAATLGLLSQVQQALDEGALSSDDVTHAFWGACHGGQAETAVVLLAASADINWIGWDDHTPLDAARRSEAPDQLIAWLQDQGATSAARQPR